MVLGFGFSGSDLASGFPGSDLGSDFSDLESGSKVQNIICFMSALQNQKKKTENAFNHIGCTILSNNKLITAW